MEKQDKLLDISQEQIKGLLNILRNTLNKGMKGGAYDLDDNISAVYDQFAIIGDQYIKLKQEFHNIQNVVKHTVEQSSLIDKAERVTR